jgi:hypothetical protein
LSTLTSTSPSLLRLQSFVAAKEKIVRAEWHLLDALEYDVNVEHPVVSLPSLVKSAVGADNRELLEAAKRTVTDSYRTQLCLQHQPIDIARGCLFFAVWTTKFQVRACKSRLRHACKSRLRHETARPLTPLLDAAVWACRNTSR